MSIGMGIGLAVQSGYPNRTPQFPYTDDRFWNYSLVRKWALDVPVHLFSPPQTCIAERAPAVDLGIFAHVLNSKTILSSMGRFLDISGDRATLHNRNGLGHRFWIRGMCNRKVKRGISIQKSLDEWIATTNTHIAIIEGDLCEEIQECRGKSKKG